MDLPNGIRLWRTLVLLVVVAEVLELRPGLLAVVEAKSNKTDLEILDGLLKNYDRRATPTPQKDQPTVVECDLYIRSFGSINPNTMDYEVDAYLRQEWTDARLNHSEIKEPMDLNDPELVKAIWKPEVYFPNAKQATFQFVTVPNVLIRIKPDGQILYMLRLRLTFSCMMELSKYPLDKQTCTMEIASFSKTLKELHITWKKGNPIKLYSNMRMPQFEVVHVNPNVCQESFQIGNYSCLKAEYHLKRSVGFHLVQSYLPTMLIVVISWVSFWMDVDSVPGRTTLGVTTLLTMSTKASGVQMEIPQVSYVKAIDVWMGACTAFIFAALLEFTLVNYFYRKDLRHAEKLQEELDAAEMVQNSGLMVGTGNNGTVGAVLGKNSSAAACCSLGNVKGNNLVLAAGSGRAADDGAGSSETPEILGNNGFIPNIMLLQSMPTKTFQPISRLNMRAHQIDECCRYIFPALFSMFNFSYWTYYLFVA